MAGVEDVTYTVGDLNRLIRQTLSRRFPDEIWVEGEIRGLTRHAASGHVYLELADPSADGRQADAVVQVALFRTDKDAVNRMLRRAGAVRMAVGVHIRIRGTIEYFPPQGRLQLRMRWIDPAYTLGRLEAERQRLVTALAGEGLLDRNRSLPFPLVPLRVGLVTSRGSAAQEDFLHELEASGLAWQVTFVAAAVQGPAAEAELVGALRTLAGRDVDVIAVVRGGGARTDLAAFDSEAVARAIAELAVPVVTGIGHETDQAVADLVAARPAKTPTACAALLVRDVTDAHDRARRAWDAIAARSRLELDRSHQRLDRVGRQVSFAGLRRLDRGADTLDRAVRRTVAAASRAPASATAELERVGVAVVAGARRDADAAAATASGQARRLRTEAPRSLRRSERTVEGWSARVAAADPARLLARGWSITRTADGAPVASVRTLRPGQDLVTTVADGTVRTTVTAVAPHAPTRTADTGTDTRTDTDTQDPI